MLGAKREEVTVDWGKMHKEELHYLCSVPNNIDGGVKDDNTGEACTE
jgi:hypothetical protein